jgi:hypothetical protein
MRSFARAAALLCLTSCGHPRAVASPREEPSLHLSPVSDLVALGGLTFVVDARPRALFSHPAVIDAIATTLPEAELDAMARARGGLDVRSMEELSVAGYASTTLLLAHQVVNPAKVEAAFTTRVAGVFARTIDSRADDPRTVLVRLAGATGKQHESLVIFGREAVGLALGEDAPLRASERFATRTLKKALPAWRGPPLDQLGAALGDGPLRAAAPGPFTGEWEHALGGLLGSASAVGGALTLEADVAKIEIVVTGPWGSRAKEAEARMAHAFDAVSASGLGRLLGLDHPATPIVLSSTPELVRFQVGVLIRPLVKGLFDATSSGIPEMLQALPPRSPSALTPHFPKGTQEMTDRTD